MPGFGGLPPPGTFVWAEDESANIVAWDYTDDQGHATVKVPAGAYHFLTLGGHYLFSSGDPG